MKPLRFKRQARIDLREARTWYRGHGIELARRFVDRVDASLDFICRSPRACAAVYRDVRVCGVRGFPYVVYFQDQPTRIFVIAVMHTSRDPQAWMSRLDEP